MPIIERKPAICGVCPGGCAVEVALEDSLPVYVEPKEGPLASAEIRAEYPLVLNTGARIQSTFRSQHLNVPGLVRLQEHPQVLINPKNARERGIEQGDQVVVSTKRGSVHFWARVTGEVLPGCVEVNMGGGNPCQVEAWRQSNTNLLTDWQNRDPISGFPVFKALLYQVTGAEIQAPSKLLNVGDSRVGSATP